MSIRKFENEKERLENACLKYEGNMILIAKEAGYCLEHTRKKVKQYKLDEKYLVNRFMVRIAKLILKNKDFKPVKKTLFYQYADAYLRKQIDLVLMVLEHKGEI